MARIITRFQRSIRNKFLAGILTIIPIGITLYTIKVLVTFFENIGRPIIYKFLPIHFPGMGLVLSLLVIYLIGIFITNVIGKRLFAFVEKWITKIPIIKPIYITTKQIIDSFSLKDRGFEKVVWIEYPRKGIWTLCFVTGETLSSDGVPYYNVFVPTTPNPTSGFALFIPKSDTLPSKLTVEAALKTIISGGALAPPQMNFLSESHLEKKKANYKQNK